MLSSFLIELLPGGVINGAKKVVSAYFHVECHKSLEWRCICLAVLVASQACIKKMERAVLPLPLSKKRTWFRSSTVSEAGWQITQTSADSSYDRG